jgi:hypothetical protein
LASRAFSAAVVVIGLVGLTEATGAAVAYDNVKELYRSSVPTVQRQCYKRVTKEQQKMTEEQQKSNK